MSTENKITYEGVEYYYNTFTATQINEYKGLRDMYYGEGGFKDGSYLERFPRESYGQTVNNVTQPDFFGQRKKLAHYENIFKPELDAKISPIFAKDQVRKVEGSGKSVIEAFIESPTKKSGETMSDYQRRKATNVELFGSIFEIVDGPTATPETGEGDLNQSAMEYAYFLNPLNVEGYGLNNDGTLNLLMYYEDIDSRNEDTASVLSQSNKTEKDSYVYRVWIKKADGTAVTFKYYQSEVMVDSIRDFDTYPVSLIEANQRYKSNEIAKSAYLSELSISKTIYNITSWYKDTFVKACFAILTYNGRLPEDLDLANGSILQYFQEGANAPDFIGPPTNQLEIQMKEVERLVQQLQSNMTSTVAISAMASGDARKEADKRRIEDLKKTSKNIEDNEKWVIDVALRNYIDADYTFTVLYLKDFETLTKADELAPLQALIDSGALYGITLAEVGNDMIDITYSDNKERAKELKAMNLKAFESSDTMNDVFDNPPDIDG